MISLGIHAYTHDAAAALVRDGEIVAAAEEERFNGRKHTDAFPKEAIHYCLQAAGVELAQVDCVAISWQPYHKLVQRVMNLFRYFPASLAGFSSSDDGRIKGNLELWNAIRKIPQTLQHHFGATPKTRFSFLRHHDCHAASAFLVSPFKDASILTCDACGEWETSGFYQGRGQNMELLHSDVLPDSLGLIYGAFTQFLGFQEKCDEGKVMALASMAPPAKLARMKEIFDLDKDGAFKVDTSFFRFQYDTKGNLYSPKLEKWLGPSRNDKEPLEVYHMEIASSMQEQWEAVYSHMIRSLVAQTGCNDLCLAGGAALNSKANGRMLEDGVAGRIFVQPAANDSGTALGAALLASSLEGDLQKKVEFSPYLGPQSSFSQCEKVVNDAGLYCLEVDDPAEIVAELLTRGQIIGWQQGRMEWGARALGNRSILADPRFAQTKEHLNARVKFREAFRPFAPAILEEFQSDYFSCHHPVPHMTAVLTVKEKMIETIPAVVHVDGTARLQTVNRKENRLYYDMIKAFYKRTGVPVVLNTSLNVQGTPIALGAKESVACLMGSGMDFLCLDRLLVCKSEEKKKLMDQVMNRLRVGE